MGRAFGALAAVALAGVNLVAIGAEPAAAAVITVTTTDDEDDVNPGTGCSLREAMESAQFDTAVGGCASGSGEDDIGFALPGSAPWTITLMNGTLPAPGFGGDDGATITGPTADASDLTIDGNDASRIMATPTGRSLTVANLTLANADPGLQAGGAISAAPAGSTLVVDNVRFVSNEAAQGAAFVLGGGSDAVVTDSVFVDNDADDDGGAIRAESTAALMISGSSFGGPDANDGNSGEDGGAISVTGTGTVSIDTSTFDENQALFSGHGGAIHVASTAASLSVTDSTFTDNVVSAGNGGAILHEGTGALT